VSVDSSKGTANADHRTFSRAPTKTFCVVAGIFSSLMLGGWSGAPEIAVHALQAAFPYFRLRAFYAKSFTLINSMNQSR